MNKSQLIEALSKHYEGNKKAAQHALESVLDTITREVAKGEKVAITGFGAFEKVVRPSRMVRNPRTGERTRAKKTAVPKFRAGADLKAVVSGAKKLARQSQLPPPSRHRCSDQDGRAKQVDRGEEDGTAKKSTAKKTAAKKSTAKKTMAKKAPAKKSTRRRSRPPRRPAKKAPAKKTAAKKAPAKKSAAKKSTAKKTAAKKAPAKKAAAKKAPAKKTTAKKAAKKR